MELVFSGTRRSKRVWPVCLYINSDDVHRVPHHLDGAGQLQAMIHVHMIIMPVTLISVAEIAVGKCELTPFSADVLGITLGTRVEVSCDFLEEHVH